VLVVVVVVWWRPHLHKHQWIVPLYIRTLDSTAVDHTKFTVIRGSSVSTASGSTAGFQYPARTTDFPTSECQQRLRGPPRSRGSFSAIKSAGAWSYSFTFSNGFGAHPVLGALFQRLKVPEREAIHSHSATASGPTPF
jgi:hypothetical protein